MRRTVIKKNVQLITLAIVSIFTLKFFQSTPFETLFFQLQAGFLGLILFFLTGYTTTFLINRNRFNKVVLYYLLLIAILPFYSAYRAGIEFGQPFIYGFLSERGWLLLGVGIWFYYQLSTKRMTFATIESAFVFMAWASLIVFSFIILTYDPNQLESAEEASKLAEMTEDRGLRFKFQTFFITFGAIYYFIKSSIENSPKDFVFLFLFLGYILFIVQGRTYMMALAATFLLYYWFNYSLGRFTLTAIKLALFLFFALIAIQILLPDYLERMSYLFAEMFRVLTGEESQEYSANARLNASQSVLNYFEAHPLSIWLGTGSVSNQWNDGYKSIFGYFYPSDIGVLGGLFVYGIVGSVFVFLIPLVILIQTLRKVSVKGDIFIISLKYLLVIALVTSIQGSLYFAANMYIITLFVLLAYFKLQERLNVNQHTTKYLRHVVKLQGSRRHYCLPPEPAKDFLSESRHRHR
ncbi:MAG: hypothetical protein PHD43_16440 [Methylococcales bacterium]|nr:hypothetical protein [Methylococcales bacterium]